MLIRLAALCGAVACLAWAVGSIDAMTASQTLRQTADKYATATSFTAGDLVKLTPLLRQVEAAPRCDGYALHAAVTIRVRMAELAFATAKRADIDAGLDDARAAAIATLRCVPTDSFAWLILFRVIVAQQGFSPEALVPLEKSYAFGRNEAWIELRRNGFALAVYDLLPADLRRTVRDEFADLVHLQFYDDAANIIGGPGWSQRAALVAALESLPEEDRYQFALALQRNIIDVRIPGITLPEARPWR